jgi:hypothetical protein
MSFFKIYKIGDQEGGTGPDWGWDGGTRGRGEVGKACGKVNMVQILCIYACKWKNDAC